MPPKMNIPTSGSRRCLHDTWQSLAVFTLATTAWVVVILFVISQSCSRKDRDDLMCDPGGKITEVAKDYNPFWDTGSFFYVNMAVFDNLTYTQAKIIDSCWDLGIGRGGQALVGIVPYTVIRQSIKLTMEKTALPISTATSVCSQQQIQAMSVWELSRAVVDRKDITGSTGSRHSKVRILACIFLCIYVLSFATISSIMTGYFTAVSGFYGSLESGEPLVRASEYGRADLLFWDARRLNASLRGQIPVGEPMVAYTYSYKTEGDFRTRPLVTVLREYWGVCSHPPNATVDDKGQIKWDKGVQEDMKIHGVNWTRKMSPVNIYSCYLPPPATELTQMTTLINTTILKISLEAPSLHLSAKTDDYESGPHEASYRGVNGSVSQADVWIRGQNETEHLSYADMSKASTCVPAKEYSWGFSLQLLLTFVIYTGLFGLTLVSMQLDVYWHSRWYHLSQPHSIYSDILAIADCLEAKFGEGVRDLAVKELDKKISGHPGGICLQTDSLPSTRSQLHRAEIRAYKAWRDTGAGTELNSLEPEPDDHELEASGCTLSGIGGAPNESAVDNELLRLQSTSARSEESVEGQVLASGSETTIPRVYSRYSSAECITLLAREDESGSHIT